MSVGYSRAIWNSLLQQITGNVVSDFFKARWKLSVFCVKLLAMEPVSGQKAVLAKAQWFAPLEVLCDGEAGQDMRSSG